MIYRTWRETRLKLLVEERSHVGSATLNSITDPKNMFITDMRKRRERPDISVPEKKKKKKK